MLFTHTIVVSLLAAASAVIAAPTRRQTPGISSPPSGANIMPGQAFDFSYTSIADYGTSSYNYTVWLATKAPESFTASENFMDGHYFGRFAEPNYPGNPNPPNPPPAQLVMPDFSKSPGGFGAGSTASQTPVYLMVLEEYSNGEGVIGNRMSLSSQEIYYNGTVSST